MTALCTALAAVNRWIFRGVAWLSLALALLGCAIVLLRKGFDWGSIAMQESLIYLHALILLGAAAHTLALDGHVRVDIFQSRFPPRRQALVDLLGTVFLLWPVSLFLLWACWGYVGDSWVRRESSAEPGGLAWVYLLKSLMIVFAVQLLLQGVVQLHGAWQRWRER